MVARRRFLVMGGICGLLFAIPFACSRTGGGNADNEEGSPAAVEEDREAAAGLHAPSQEPGESQLKGLSAVVQGNNRFAFDLYARLRSATPGNLFFSPYSISTAFAIAHAGAAGETRRQLAKSLHFTLPELELNQAMLELREALLTAKGVELRTANALWRQKGDPFHAEFLETIRKHYSAELDALDFARDTEAARREINEWARNATEGRIRDLLAPGALDPQAALVLANAVYFKADWRYKFLLNNTGDAPFHLSSDSTVVVPRMYQRGWFGYRATEDLQVLEMPYAKGELSMLLLLPKEIDGLAELEKKLTKANLPGWTEGLQEQTVIVYLPRFKITSQWSLKDALEALGMTTAFDARKADFSRVSPGESLYISVAVHKAHVELNEEGTVAAAATAVVESKFDMSSGKPREPPVFRADHPFSFLIRDNRSGAVLFLGRVMNPQQ